MPWHVVYEVPHRLLRVHAQGTLDVPALDALGRELVAWAMEKNVRRFLVDYRDAAFNLAYVDAFDFPTKLLSEGFPRGARLALVYASRDAETFLFYENVAVNRGLGARVFRELADAEDWVSR